MAMVRRNGDNPRIFALVDWIERVLHARNPIPGFRHSASISAYTRVFDALWTRVNAP
jgi:hypothetical protein